MTKRVEYMVATAEEFDAFTGWRHPPALAEHPRCGIRDFGAVPLQTRRMSKRTAEYVHALRAGQNADVGDPNPYRDISPLLARIWRRGYETMLTIRCAATPAMQQYLRDRAAAET